MWEYNYNNQELYHYGVLGMKWGQRQRSAMRAAERNHSRNEKIKKQDAEAKNMNGTELGSGRKMLRQIQRSHPYSDYAGKGLSARNAVKQRNADINNDIAAAKAKAGSKRTDYQKLGVATAKYFLRNAAINMTTARIGRNNQNVAATMKIMGTIGNTVVTLKEYRNIGKEALNRGKN